VVAIRTYALSVQQGKSWIYLKPARKRLELICKRRYLLANQLPSSKIFVDRTRYYRSDMVGYLCKELEN
jgi:hypothetical protein